MIQCKICNNIEHDEMIKKKCPKCGNYAWHIAGIWTKPTNSGGR